MSNESYDGAYRRGFEESQGIRGKGETPKNDSVRQGYEAGKTAGNQSGSNR